MRDRRAIVFLVFAGAAAALTPVAETKFKWVCVAVAITYVVLAIASTLDARSRRRR